MSSLLNNIKTVFLMGLLTALLLYLGHLIGGIRGFTIMAIFSIAFNFISWYYSDKIVLTMYGAKEVPKNSKLYKIVRELAREFNLPMPKVYIAPLPIANAFATGRSPKHAAVCVTEGILKILNERELKGVLAHELSHIKNRDTLISTIATSIATLISYLAYFVRFIAFTRDDDNSSYLEVLLISLLAPLIATLIQLAISRAREYVADETGARTIKDPIALAKALEKLENSVKLKASPSYYATENLFIVNPFSGSALLYLFSTHPPTHERIKRLLKLAEEIKS